MVARRQPPPKWGGGLFAALFSGRNFCRSRGGAPLGRWRNGPKNHRGDGLLPPETTIATLAENDQAQSAGLTPDVAKKIDADLGVK